MKKKHFLLLAVVYLGFISLGLPDQILGVAWNSIQNAFQRDVSDAGILYTTITIFTIISSFFSGFFIKRFSTNTILIFCTFLTSFALLGYAFSGTWETLLLFCIPYGLGAGTVDSALNSFASKNLNIRQMNWLHGFWGVGASLGPALMIFTIKAGSNWRVGYIVIAAILFALFLFFIFTRAFWKVGKDTDADISAEKTEETSVKGKGSIKDVLKLKPFLSMAFFFIYAILEVGIGLWAATMMIGSRGYDGILAGNLVVAYWVSLTVGRFLIGTVALKFGARKIVTYGLHLAFFGMCLFWFQNFWANAIGLMIYGLSISGLFPSMMTLATERFGENTADILCGYQVGFAYLGVATLPALVGFIIGKTQLEALVPITMGAVVLLILIDFNLNKSSKGA